MNTPDQYATLAEEALQNAHALTESSAGLLLTASKREIALAAVPIIVSLVEAGYNAVLTMASAIVRQR